MKKKKKMVLTEEEMDLEESIHKGEWASVGTQYKQLYEAAAKDTLIDRKEARVNIRMTERELTLIRIEAEREGIPYQTLMSSILHKYLTGQLLDRKIVEEIKNTFSSAKLKTG